MPDLCLLPPFWFVGKNKLIPSSLINARNCDDICIPAERVLRRVTIEDLDVVSAALVVSLQQERVEGQLNDEPALNVYEPRTVDSVWVDLRVLW